MKIKAEKQIIDFDASERRVVIINKGDTDTVSDGFGQTKIDDSYAVEVIDDLPQLDHDGDGEPGGSEPHEPPSLSGKNKAQLIAIAADEGVEVNESMTNAAITEAIEAAREADDADGPPAD